MSDNGQYRAETARGDVDEALPAVREFGLSAPLRWLARGFDDVLRAPAQSLFYGVVLAVMGYLLVQYFGGAVGLALTTGFLLLGPFLAVGLYDISRQLEHASGSSFRRSLTAWRANLPAIGFYALILMLSLAVWTRISVVLLALLAPSGDATMLELLRLLLNSPASWLLAGGYLVIGALLAAFSFAISAVALPMLLERERMDAISAMIVSFQCIRRNPCAMALWAAIIVALTTAGFLAWFAGLALTIPLIGHATWHAYREAVDGYRQSSVSASE